ncbi:MAG: TIGR03905 family TSCPD domain-containing protein [Spirochaetaceae bacterium]|jgi:uncharacterized protein (TIGR03905 family)|nr:TIGR03905 family TSCPD domain-containing protein [Spirochaetaceae bacterium]
MYEYKTHGTCSVALRFDINENKIHHVEFDGGCNGNLKAIAKLVEGMDAQECIGKLKGIRCGYKPTSCGDQLAAAIELALENT